MTIVQMEQRYRQLVAEFQAGRLDRQSFARAVDRLRFQDTGGRHWMLGAQSGTWYCYDGQAWQPADPGLSLPAEAAAAAGPEPEGRPLPEPVPAGPRPAGRFRLPALAVGAALVLLAALLFWPLLSMPVAGAPLAGPLPAPSPRPPLSEGSGGNGGGSGGGNGGVPPQGIIVGTVTDLSLGRPAAGVDVEVSGSLVRTDTDGSYSVTGLPAGTYTVSPALGGQGMAAQGPVVVYVDGRSTATIDLGYYSQPPATYTPQPVAAIPAAISPAKPPPALPDAGGDLTGRPPLLIGLGLALFAAGSVGLVKHNPVQPQLRRLTTKSGRHQEN
jgi:hypothetical protein